MHRPDTPSRSNSSRRLFRDGRIVIAALFTPLLLLLFVTVMTWRSEGRIAAVTDRLVHDYAAIAVWQYARGANMALHNEVMEAFSGAPPPTHLRSDPAASLEPPSRLLTRRGTSDNAFLEHAELAFTYQAGADRLVTTGAPDADVIERMLRRRLRAVSRDQRSGGEPHHVLFDSAGGRDYAAALWLVRHAEGDATVARGILVKADVLENLFRGVISQADLLPAVAGRRVLESTDLALRVTRPDEAIVFATPLPLGRTAATDTSGIQGGALRATIDLPPELVEELLVGGAPRSLIPALLLVLLVSGALAATGLVHHTRSRALAQARARFVANVSHELRTPLAQISMFAETLHLGRERGEAERRQFASIMFLEARRLTALVENVLRFSRSEHGAPSLRLRRQVIDELVANAVNTFAPIADGAGVSIEVQVPKSVCASVDAAAFHQIVLNLLDNAVKHGGRNSRVHVAACLTEGMLRVMVDDSGPGIPMSDREQVFEPYFQLEGHNVAGAGIGLSIVRDLVVAHGGRVWVEDSPLGGARLIAAFPAGEPEIVRGESQPAHALG